MAERTSINGSLCVVDERGNEAYLTDDGGLFIDTPIDSGDDIEITGEDLAWLLGPQRERAATAAELTDWAVRCLNEWAFRMVGRAWTVEPQHEKLCWRVRLRGTSRKPPTAALAHEAMIATARALYAADPTLPPPPEAARG